MGNQQHLEWLLEGVEAWNARREKEPFVPDLSGMDVHSAFERRELLNRYGRFVLPGANLGRAVLTGSNLRGADLKLANLIEADLRWADLTGGVLAGAKFTGADLRGAALRAADLLSADLEGANLTTSYFRMGLKDGSTAKYSDLRRSLYLQQHQINVAVGDTGVLLPKGIAHPPHWPDPAPPEQEDAKPKPPTEPAPAPDPFIFLSYASEDRDAAEALLTLLKDQGLPFWWDQYILGDGWRDQIAERLNAAKAVLAVWTEASVASDGVREEAAIAQKAGKLVHARLNDAALPYGFGETQWIDLRRWDGETSHPDFQKLLLSLRTKLDPPSTAEKRARRRAGSAVEAVRDGARITLKNTPVNVAPPRDEPVLKAQRLQALWVNGQGMRDLAEEDGQCPLRIKQVLDHFLATPARDDPDWFVLSFRNDRLRDGLAECPDLDKSNGTLRTGILGLIQQVGELEPFLNPEQPEPDAPQAKPVQLDPELPGDRLEEVAARLSELSDALRTQDANDGLNDGTRAHLSDLADDGANAAADKNHDPAAEDRNVSRARRSLQKLTYALETIVEKAGEKTMKAFLNEAAKGVAERLKPFAEWLASFF